MNLVRHTMRFATLCVVGLSISGCATALHTAMPEAEIAPQTGSQRALVELPPPAAPTPVAVYSFADETGQFKPSDSVQTLSRAVTQGGASLLMKALRDTGDGQWFTVVEREGLQDLLQERKIIREMRHRYLGEARPDPRALPPLLFAGVLLKGGIVGYDTNTLTGGLGAAFLGIGGDIQYRQSTVTVNLRAVSVKTGQVLANVTTVKNIASVGAQGSAFKYVSFDELLEIEAGITTNEPGSLAVRRAIEKSVHSLILEGAHQGVWGFAPGYEQAGAELVEAYLEESNNPALTQDKIAAATSSARQDVEGLQSAGFDSAVEGVVETEEPLKPAWKTRRDRIDRD